MARFSIIICILMAKTSFFSSHTNVFWGCRQPQIRNLRFHPSWRRHPTPHHLQAVVNIRYWMTFHLGLRLWLSVFANIFVTNEIKSQKCHKITWHNSLCRDVGWKFSVPFTCKANYSFTILLESENDPMAQYGVGAHIPGHHCEIKEIHLTS